MALAKRCGIARDSIEQEAKPLRIYVAENIGVFNEAKKKDRFLFQNTRVLGIGAEHVCEDIYSEWTSIASIWGAITPHGNGGPLSSLIGAGNPTPIPTTRISSNPSRI